MFFIFVKACKKYKFSYTLNTSSGFTLTLHPNNTFVVIEIKQNYFECSYFKLFLKAIKKMKLYRKEAGH